MIGVCFGKFDSLDYDSGVRDMSFELVSLQQLVEFYNFRLLSIVQDDSFGMEILDVVNRVSIFWFSCMYIIYGKFGDVSEKNVDFYSELKIVKILCYLDVVNRVRKGILNFIQNFKLFVLVIFVI